MKILPSGCFSILKAGFSFVIAVALCALGFSMPALGQQSNAQRPNAGSLGRQARLAALNDPSLPGVMPTFYSPGQKARAQFLQGMLSGEMHFFHEQFGVVFAPITMAVLTPEQWPKVARGLPYGMPSMSRKPPYIFVMPSDWHSVPGFSSEKVDLDPELLRRVRVSGETLETLKIEGGDGIGAHEIGHSIIRQLGIDPQTRWFDEFLATYTAYVYLNAGYPKYALGMEMMWRVDFLNLTHAHTSLDYFETNYHELVSKEPGNYGWYQSAFGKRALAIYPQEGPGFLDKIRKDFSSGGPKLDNAQVLDKLETINPGWKAWAQHLGAGSSPTPH